MEINENACGIGSQRLRLLRLKFSSLGKQKKDNFLYYIYSVDVSWG